ncbi:hypothetical protein D3C86_688270 [compost metagenome]
MKKTLPFLLAALLTGCSPPGNWGGLPLTGSETFTVDDAFLDAQYMTWWQGRPVPQADVEFLARWAVGPGTSKRQLGKLIFIYTPKDI